MLASYAICEHSMMDEEMMAVPIAGCHSADMEPMWITITPLATAARRPGIKLPRSDDPVNGSCFLVLRRRKTLFGLFAQGRCC